MYKNLNLKDVIIPVDFVTFEKLLIEANYDRLKMHFLIDGFRYGFEIGYEGSRCVRQTAPNLKFRGVGSKLILWNKVMKEVKLGRYAGHSRKSLSGISSSLQLAWYPKIMVKLPD